MPFNSTTPLVQLAEAQSMHSATVNGLLAACAPAVLFGVRSVSGLVLTLYGGMLPIAGTPTYLADQAVTLSASATNYIYATSAGVVTKTTSIPGSWPGPLAAGAVALYTIVTGAATIASGTCYRIGTGLTGPIGATGAQGNPGSDFALTRKRIAMSVGGGSILTTQTGGDNLTVVGTQTAVTLSTATLRQSIPYQSIVSSASAGVSAQIYMPRNTMWLGNAAGRGGFALNLRICMESGASPATFRCLFGMLDKTGGTIANVEPDTLLNFVGIGSKAGDANLSFMHNDGSGTATMVALGANFPARSTDNVYELQLTSVANSGVVAYSITDVATGNVATGSASSDLPSNTTFMTWVTWVNNGSTAAAASFGWMQTISESRY